MKKRLLSCIVCICMAFCSFNADIFAKDSESIVILYENDVHCAVEGYEDVFSVSDYAIEAFQWTCGSGIMSGNTISTLAPNEQVSRIYFASVLHKYTQSVEIKSN